MANIAGRTEAQIFRVFLSGQGHADALLTRYGAYEPLLRAQDPPRPEWSDLGEGEFSYSPEWNYNFTEGIAHSWEIAPDQSKITFQIREGVPFHNDWGHVTAEDVAFSFNDAISAESVFTRADRLGEWIDRVEAVDEFTVDMHISSLNATWDIRLSNVGDTTVPIVSKRAFDTLGSEEFNVTDTGTGPFTVRTWRTGDEIIMDRFADYYREDGRAQVAAIRYVTMPEQNVQLAALETGEVDIATGASTGLDFQLVSGAAERSGGKVIEFGHPGRHEITFGGNYWAETDPDTGDPLPRRPGFTPDSDHPWIGDPWGDGNSMESARLVRWAMSMAIDRELLNEIMFESLGTPAYTNIGSLPGDEAWKDEWLIPYDPDMARQHLAEAGYPDGFSFRFYAGTSPLAEPIGQMWSAIGLDITIDSTGYEALRPSRVEKSMNSIYTCGPPGEERRTLDEAKGGLLIPRLGVTCSVELPDDIWPLYFANNDELLGPEHREERVQNNIKLQDFLSNWMLGAPVVYSPASLYIVNEGVEWYPHQADFAFFNSPETIVLHR
ncbi:MAG: ABC transporter substrate-binding protein [Dehalococcoidia bacterium]